MDFKKRFKNYSDRQIEADLQQPLGKDGFVNPIFNKLYGKDKNPYTGTERDRDSIHKKYY